MGTERVYSYFDYDGEVELPEEGVADCGGAPHYFWLREGSSTPRHGIYDLAPIDAILLAKVVEAEAIWHAWDLDYHAGRVELDSYPMRSGVNLHFSNLMREISAAASRLCVDTFRRGATFMPTQAYLADASQFQGKRWPAPGLHSATFEVSWLNV
ncbi:hypothetical protein [Variovorax sp. J2P1-31]|uniref:hypothetical protein n=1 Tax=Variovorax sp. J2P1-31 TaxID=3053497 RepID=UPI00257708B3|nr:hypothetical protein [Variovorax sp. J2P1-31]MDM0086621.1 hypothetical protein [Variovorax sp. J22G40]MDM0145123.1 hypothetical protein [Variovorax sp. J2P1-31]